MSTARPLLRNVLLKEVHMRSAMMFAAGLLVGVAVHVGLAQSAGGGPRTAW